MFAHLVHSDWSKEASGRWSARATLQDGLWHAEGPDPVGPLPAFVDDLFARARTGPVLAGFDFPIGLPASVAAHRREDRFPDFVDGLDEDDPFFDVATVPEEIGPARPFYPDRPGGARRAHLVAGHGVETIDALTRRCERGGIGARDAGCMFWTLGAKQVGKAMLHGWRTVIRPARRLGAHLWPFDGALATLARAGGVTLAETYPGDAYRQIALPMGRFSKRRLSDRSGAAAHLLAWACERRIRLGDGLRAAIEAGCPVTAGGDDGFDALVGLLAIIAVVGGERPSGEPPAQAVQRWEGWILGRADGSTTRVGDQPKRLATVPVVDVEPDELEEPPNSTETSLWLVDGLARS